MRNHYLIIIGWLLLLTGLTVTGQQTNDPVRPDLTLPEFGAFDPATLDNVALDTYEVLPEWTDHAALIFADGQDSRRNPAMVSKVGDSMTASDAFLVPFANDDSYQLAEYAHLETVIDFIQAESQVEDGLNAFNRPNYATEIGFSTTSVLDPTWANTDVCEPNESPLACEYRVSNAAWALIMFGTNDVMYFDTATFDYYYRQVVLDTIEANVVPVLYLFPPRPEKPELSMQFNRIIARVAADYEVPLVNMLPRLDALPAYGVDPNDPLHLTYPDGNATVAIFTETGLTGGYTWRNLTTLEALDSLLRSAGVLADDTEPTTPSTEQKPDTQLEETDTP